LSQTKQDTFLSCNSFLNETNQNINNSNSINELQIIFDQNCLYYQLDKINTEWYLLGECNLQLIVDESSKSKYKANILCNLLNEKTTVSNEINELFKFNKVRNSTKGLYWWTNEINSVLVEFDNEKSLNELQSLFLDAKSKFEQINKVKSPQKLSINQWQPPDVLPNKSISLLDRQITLNLNDNFEYSSVNLNVSELINEPSMQNFHLITISNKDGKNVLYKHCLNKNTKFETR
jgi:hypothetical protein